MNFKRNVFSRSVISELSQIWNCAANHDLPPRENRMFFEEVIAIFLWYYRECKQEIQKLSNTQRTKCYKPFNKNRAAILRDRVRKVISQAYLYI
jgi:hypothetical protein